MLIVMSSVDCWISVGDPPVEWRAWLDDLAGQWTAWLDFVSGRPGVGAV